MILLSNLYGRKVLRYALYALAALLLGMGLLSGKTEAGAPPDYVNDLSVQGEGQAPVNSRTMQQPAPRIRVAAGSFRDRDRPGGHSTVLYSQYNQPGEVAVSSQNFGPPLAAADSQAADDFIVPAGETWVIEQVEVAGAYSADGGEPTSVNLFFYNDAGALPGEAIVTRKSIAPGSGLDTGNLVVPLDPPVILQPGAHWLSVQANDGDGNGGQWFWRTRKVRSNNYAAWRNPGWGFGNPYCGATWGHHATICFVSNDAPDQVFRLAGRREGGSGLVTPTGRAGAPTPGGSAPPPNVAIPPPVPTDSPTPTLSPTAIPPCGLNWRQVPSADPGATANILLDVAAVGANDAWAVGYYSDGGPLQTLIQRWNGAAWTVVPSPNSSSTNNTLSGVDVVSTNDVWAVGEYYEPGGTRQPLFLHWDGIEWSIVPTGGGLPSSSLADVDAISANDVWAVGFCSCDDGMAFIMHWNGSAWSRINTPNLGNNLLFGVSGLSANDVWAVGRGQDLEALTLHWDGVVWSEVPTPDFPDDSALRAVVAISPNDVWAVGYYFVTFFDYVTLTMHWDGSQWTIVPSPEGEINSDLSGVSATSGSDVWAVGHGVLYEAQSPMELGTRNRTLTMRWNGSQWTEAPSPNPGHSNRLEAVASLSPGYAWAAGSYSSFTQPGRSLVERYNDPCLIATPTNTSTRTPTGTPTNTPTRTPTNTPTRTPTSTPTNTPTNTPTSTPTDTPASTPTDTSTPTSTSTSTQTATPTPTSCPLAFTDVDVNNTFYSSVRCLVCRSIISGYGDGSFRPNNEVTRGQLAKIVSNAAGFSEDPGPQLYEDVPPAQTFYQWINRLSMRGHMGGYPCGQLPAEPCGPDNRPYFRPGANATRGQTSKIVSNAAGYREPATSQSFEDVPPSHPFYAEIERLASRGVMGGYPCGGAGEPCGVGNLPYFRPQNDVTRGQSAKIVANTFYPDCQTP